MLEMRGAWPPVTFDMILAHCVASYPCAIVYVVCSFHPGNDLSATIMTLAFILFAPATSWIAIVLSLHRASLFIDLANRLHTDLFARVRSLSFVVGL